MRHLAAVAFAALLFPQPSTGQGPPTLTEEEFLAPLAAEHPAVSALGLELAAARADVVAAGTLDNPELGAVREDPSGATEQLDVTLSWQPPHPGRRRLAVAAAEAGVDAARHRLDEALLGLELRLREVYARWAVGVARAELLGDHAARIESLADRERLRARSGESSGLAARRLALAAVEVRAAHAGAAAEADGAAAAARAWRPDLHPEVRPALPALPELAPAPGTSSAEPPKPVHPGLAALEADLEAARRERELSGRALAMPEVIAGWQRQEGGDRVADGPIVGLSWPLPLFDRNRPERRAAESRIATTSARLELLRRELEAERDGRRAAYRRLRQATTRVAAASETGGPAVEAATAAFRLGEANLTDLIETLRSASGAALAALDLHASALAAARDLARVSPQSLPSLTHRSAAPDPPRDDPPGETP